ncbi:MAG: SpoIID/LytB domain-containing protein [Lachnospiraceae bacterium]|nr:SpoIID/LytB domain-containing protein [Lachnospiraceae bacterium]
MAFHTKKHLCYLFLVVLILFLFLPWKLQNKEQPEGELMIASDFLTSHRLINRLLEAAEEEERYEYLQEAEKLAASWQEEQVTYKQWWEWLNFMEEDFHLLSEEEEEKLEMKYSDSLFVVKEDGAAYFEKLYGKLDEKKEIIYQTLLILGDHRNVTDLEGKPIEEELVFTDNGKWSWEAEGMSIPQGKKLSCLTYQGGIWSVEESKEESVLKNTFLVDSKENRVTCFYNNYYIDYENFSLLPEESEQIADLIFKDGKVEELIIKEEKLSGKVMKLSEKEVELAKQGSIPLAKEVQYYQLNGPLKNIGRNQIPLGYNFTDFIIQEGEIQAALLVRDEKMENLRVLIKTPEFQGYFHPKITLSSEVELELFTGSRKEVIAPGEIVEITPDSSYFESNRIFFTPKALTGRTYFPELNRANKGQGFLGAFEIEKREEGLILINEVSLEEYLYAVVPSEMPGYYPLEALKAQAISARTYAYQRMKTPGLSAYGANLDDSSTYQVYNNISENANTTRAVRETKGKLLYAAGRPADTYYYSTSWGYGTDTSVWSKEGDKAPDYLKAREMALGEVQELPDLKKEEVFQEFIMTEKEEHLESKEAWYRWSYSHKNMEVIIEKLANRLQQYPQYVCFYPKTEKQEFLPETAEIQEIEIRERKEGGSAHTLWFHTNQGIVEVTNEYHVRAVLADGEAIVSLQDGTSYACKNLLPSSFFILSLQKEGEKITGLSIRGGGFGHGVGMSQNGAKNLANQGFLAEQILTFYYQGCEVRE